MVEWEAPLRPEAGRPVAESVPGLAPYLHGGKLGKAESGLAVVGHGHLRSVAASGTRWVQLGMGTFTLWVKRLPLTIILRAGANPPWWTDPPSLTLSTARLLGCCITVEMIRLGWTRYMYDRRFRSVIVSLSCTAGSVGHASLTHNAKISQAK